MQVRSDSSSTSLATRAHRFHIPVMGTGFTTESPQKVGWLGIDSVISLVDDELIELLRRKHARLEGLPFSPISSKEDDARARRIAAYLDDVQSIVDQKTQEVKSAASKK